MVATKLTGKRETTMASTSSLIAAAFNIKGGYVTNIRTETVLVTVHGLTTLDLQAMSFPDSAKIKAF